MEFQNHTFPARANALGFTLIELIIVVAITGVILSLALPSYKQTIYKARRSDAKIQLLDIATRQEQLMLDNSTYTVDLSELGYSNQEAKNNFYSITMTPCKAGNIKTCYLLTAKPSENSQQKGDKKCTSFSINSYGEKTSTGTAQDECW